MKKDHQLKNEQYFVIRINSWLGGSAQNIVGQAVLGSSCVHWEIDWALCLYGVSLMAGSYSRHSGLKNIKKERWIPNATTCMGWMDSPNLLSSQVKIGLETARAHETIYTHNIWRLNQCCVLFIYMPLMFFNLYRCCCE